MKTFDKFDNKSILIWGYGREGQSTHHFLERCCSPLKIEIFEGAIEDIDEAKYDFIIKSPGIVMEEDNEKYTSQTEIFLEAYHENVIGITGTKGKSTTSAMLHHVLSQCTDKKVILLGNIGKPCLDYFDQIDKDTIVVFEMSCHQLAHILISPHIAVFLNIYEEHLDYYKTFDKYYAAKCNITKYQGAKDLFFRGDQLPDITTAAKICEIRRDAVKSYSLHVPGAHNDYNAEFVFKIATEVFGADEGEVRTSLKSYTGLPHRLQFIGEYDGISFYDDSISTIPNATIEALEAISNAYSVLIGGMDRKISYELLIDYIETHPQYTYILAYESGKRIYDSLKQKTSCHLVSDLREAVETAKRITPAGKACILSPAAASYGYFKNFEERGDVFKMYVEGN